jgi:hypothetical protein
MMKNKSPENTREEAQRVEADPKKNAPRGGAPESPASRETFPERTKKPGSAGLANEARPGLGSRADEGDPAAGPTKPPKEAKSNSAPKATRYGYEEPRPEPRDQPPDSLAHEQERQSGVSGHSGGT